jgi:hypothetical protein
LALSHSLSLSLRLSSALLSALLAAPSALGSLSTRSWALDRIDQHSLPLDGLYEPSFGEGSANYDSSTDYGAGVTIHLLDTGWSTGHRSS